MKFDFNSFFLYSKAHTAQFVPTMSDVMVNAFGKDPFVLLMSCLISLRAKDRVTTGICQKLFSDAPTLESLRALPRGDLEKRLFSVGFYKVKAQTLHNVCDFLIERFQGKVPSTMEELLVIPGVGRKTANLVLGMAFDQPSICVDVHVHRIANELGWLKTKTPEETEFALQALIQKDLWIECNRQLVLIGQNGCLSTRGCGLACEIKKRGFLGPR